MADFDPTAPAVDPDATRDPTTAAKPTDVDPDATICPDETRAPSPASRDVSRPRFRVLRPHARGGLGEVFIAHDEELRREVAFKEIQGRHADDPACRARFVLEAEVTGGLEHPGIIPVYGLGHYPDGRPYYAMRLIRGDSLKEAIRHHHQAAAPADLAERTLRFRTLLGRFVDVCNAVAYAHSRHVLHRDLKPGNVMLGPFGETLVVDWGLAKPLGRQEIAPGPEGALRPLWAEGSVTMMGSAVGTPAFMSPEQAAGDLDNLGPASDVYSLGATLYELLTARAPFEGDDVSEILARVRRGEFPPPRQVRRDVTRALEAVCLKAMALRPADRYDSARALADDVERWLAGAPVSAYRDWLPVRLWRRARRRPATATVAIACLLVDLLVSLLLLASYAQNILHDRLGAPLRLALASLVFAPFAGQAGALVGASIGAMIGAALRRGTERIRRSAWTGLIVGAGLGFVGLVISLVAVSSPIAAAMKTKAVAAASPAPAATPALPGAVVAPPAWVGPGAPFDVAASFAAPPPGENAAPLYLDALMEFDPVMAACFPPEEGRRRGDQARERRERAMSFAKDPATADRAKLDELLEEYEVGFLKLALAQRRRCAFQPGVGIGTLLPHAQAAREVARVAQLRSRRQLERGELDRVIQDVDRLLRLSRDLRPRGDLIVQLMSLALDHVACESLIRPILDHPDARAAHCVGLLAVLDRHVNESLEPYVEGNRAEFVTMGESIRRVGDQLAREERWGASRVRGVLKPLLAGDSPFGGLDKEMATRYAELESAVAAQLAGTTPDAFTAALMRDHEAYYREVLDLAKLPLPERTRRVAPLPRRRLVGQPLLLFLTPDNGVFLRAQSRHDATVGASRCRIALRLWELAGKGPPTDLAAAVRAAGMSAVPPDPYREDGGPLRLAIARDGPIVYAIGPDGIDDAGRIDCELGNKPRGDLLYPLHAPRAGR